MVLLYIYNYIVGPNIGIVLIQKTCISFLLTTVLVCFFDIAGSERTLRRMGPRHRSDQRTYRFHHCQRAMEQSAEEGQLRRSARSLLHDATAAVRQRRRRLNDRIDVVFAQQHHANGPGMPVR